MVTIMTKRILWSIEVPKTLNDKVDNFISSNVCDYKTKSEFIRDAVRKALKEAQS